MKTLLDRDRWAEVFETLLRNKRRSITTSFGIFWGLFILVVLLSISQAFRAGMQNNTAAFSKNVVYVWPMPTSKAYEGLPVGRRFTFRERDTSLVVHQPRCKGLIWISLKSYT